jgi:hypothetical protein
MERGAWTEERLDDLAARMDTGFERVDHDIRDLRTEMSHMRVELTGRIDGLNQTILRLGGAMLGGMMIGFLSVIAAVLTRAS